MAVPSTQVGVQLSDEEYEQLESAARRQDCSIADLIRQAIRQVYMDDLERDLSALDVQPLGETPLLMEEDEEAIGIRGPRIPPKQGV